MQLILGSSGAGKSYLLYKSIIDEALKNPQTNYIIIVPEQFTMQTQKDIINLHPNYGIINIDVLSFTRLAFRIIEELGSYNKTVLEDTGKSMVIRKVVEMKKKELSIFSANIKKVGFINELNTLLSEFHQYNIDDKTLDKALKITSKNQLLNTKLKDILIIYNAFKEFLSDKFITTEGILDILAQIINQSQIIKNSVICLDSFATFSPLQYKVLEQLLNYCKSMKVSLTIDPSENIYKVEEEFKLFNITQKTIAKLLEITSHVKVKREKDLIINDNVVYRFKNSTALASLEKNLFRYPFKKYIDKQNDISIHSTRNPNDEVEFITKEILKLVSENNYRYKDIAIVTGDIEIYSNIIQNIFEKNNIPFFTDNKRNILANPFVELIRSSLEIIIKDFSYESVFRFLRCGLTDININDIDIIETYVLSMGIKGNKRWQQQWDREYKGNTKIDLDLINTIRQKIVNMIMPLRRVLKDKNNNIKAFSQALWDFILSLNIEQKLEAYKIKFTQQNELILAKQYDQIYKLITDLFDKVVELLGNEIVSIQEYSGILDAGFEETKMGLVPPGIDQIIFGDIERTRLKDIKVLFFIGVNDGIIPKSNIKGNIISDIEKQILADNGIELSPTSRQGIYTERFYLYSNLTKPKEKLYISFSNLSSSGKSIKPSYLIGTIKKLFEIQIIDEEQINNMTINEGLKYLAQGLREYTQDMPIQWKELYNWYFVNDYWNPKLIKLLDAAFCIDKETKLSKSTAIALYGKQLNNNVTRLEKYAGCAYAHFLNYGLQLEQRQNYTFSLPDMGNIFHMVIERFGNKLQNHNTDWNNISDNERDKLVEACVDEITTEYGNKILKSSSRNEYIINRIHRITKRTVWALQQQIKNGKFVPSKYEIQFSNIEDLNSINIELSKDEILKIKGRIDRLDKYEDDQNVYIKIIDYKSGQTEFDIVALYYGLQLQLVVYMNAAIELEQRNTDKNVVPAGIFYYNIDDPIIEKLNTKADIENVNKEILNKLKMEGAINEQQAIIKLVDKDYDGKSNIVSLKNCISDKQFQHLSKFVNKKVVEFAKQILAGNIEINPYKTEKHNACEYCPFNSICGFEQKTDEYRKLKKYKSKDIWNLIEDEAD